MPPDHGHDRGGNEHHPQAPKVDVPRLGVAAATFAGASPTVAPRILAGCTTNSEPGNNSLDCEPPAVSDFNGAPSEMYLTDTNPGIASDRGR